MFDQRMADLRLLKEPEKTIVFTRKGLMFGFNFHVNQSLTNVLVPVSSNHDYKLILSSEDHCYGGHSLVQHMVYPAKEFNGQWFVELYLPARTAVVLEEIVPVEEKPKRKPGRPKKVKTEGEEKPKKASKPRKKKTEE